MMMVKMPPFPTRLTTYVIIVQLRTETLDLHCLESFIRIRHYLLALIINQIVEQNFPFEETIIVTVLLPLGSNYIKCRSILMIPSPSQLSFVRVTTKSPLLARNVRCGVALVAITFITLIFHRFYILNKWK